MYYGQRLWSIKEQSVVTCFIAKTPVRIEHDASEQEGEIVRFLRNRHIFGLAGFVLFVAISALAHDPWLIVATGTDGVINVHTTQEELVRLYGAQNVVDRDVDVGEGEIEAETVLFPNDPERRLEVLWKNPDKRAPTSVIIRGRASHWHAVHRISLGTTLTELQRVNDRPFRFDLKNDGTDMATEAISWRGGSLQKEFQGEGHIILWLVCAPTQSTPSKGPRDFGGESDTPEIQTLNLYITEMTWIFPQAHP